MTDESSRLASPDDYRWAPVDAEAKPAVRDQLYRIPSRWERDHLQAHVPDGGYVKLIFRIRNPAGPGLLRRHRLTNR